jgi:ATP-dependent Lon protease
MTVEITLRGTDLPIGGLKENSLEELRAGILRVLMPNQNENDL